MSDGEGEDETGQSSGRLETLRSLDRAETAAAGGGAPGLPGEVSGVVSPGGGLRRSYSVASATLVAEAAARAIQEQMRLQAPKFEVISEGPVNDVNRRERREPARREPARTSTTADVDGGEQTRLTYASALAVKPRKASPPHPGEEARAPPLEGEALGARRRGTRRSRRGRRRSSSERSHPRRRRSGRWARRPRDPGPTATPCSRPSVSRSARRRTRCSRRFSPRTRCQPAR